jgi:hypothetical protein
MASAPSDMVQVYGPGSLKGTQLPGLSLPLSQSLVLYYGKKHKVYRAEFHFNQEFKYVCVCESRFHSSPFITDTVF